ncbi:MAG: YggT family protein [Propionibacterium sp.]|nr:YggT family protein [Propionibacterium sp.]MDN6795312.1 YggT family protein [Propionibacterium sp.]
MVVLHAVGTVIYWVAGLYMLVLLTRMVLDWVRFFSPQWRPRGILLAVANLVYALSDPPLRLLRRRIPPLRLGQGFALDVGFMVLFIAVILVQRLGLLLLGA